MVAYLLVVFLLLHLQLLGEQLFPLPQVVLLLPQLVLLTRQLLAVLLDLRKMMSFTILD